MSYCLNPDCQKPHNTRDAKFCKNCGSPLLLGERYRAIKPIGAGGFGRTFEAEDEGKPSHPRCVIKQFFPQNQGFIDTIKAAELFRAEASRLEVLGKHPQIPELLAHFEKGQQQYLIQEFIDGRNLAVELAESGAFNEFQIRQLLQDLLPVLDFIHSHKVIHRDIKPENIIRRTSDKKLVLVDFGAAKLVNHTILQKTDTAIGSAAYAAPEQMMGKAVFASDLYSLGVTCIHLLTEIPPFDLFDNGEGTWAWRDFVKQPISAELARVLDKMIQTAVNRRYLSAAQVIKALNIPQKQSPNARLTSAEKETNTQIIPAFSTQENIQNQCAKIQQILQNALSNYQLKVQVNLSKDNKLTLVLNRNKYTPVNYKTISKIISKELTALQLTQIDKIKAFGRVKRENIPEWQQLFKVTPPANNKLNLPEDKNIFLNKYFWLDTLMFFMIFFIFNKIIVFKAANSLLIAGGFIVVKKYLAQNNKKLKDVQLFKELGLLTLLINFLNIQILFNDAFGIFLAILFIALPFLYIKEDVE
ncbi:MAG: serine/threonine protein kinase [Oscillatoriaceae bacterium SKW80]|nr:serine/threonine protein kinase [Oscillatoriaceae bacterium SKYG93]MCX8121418.1 serine/threonine protein kinase [Oscillatoriaceae bacterium SKW80]MDW8451905.1 serine/threonine-protein kinase [Oscillatoriaceae cyanobacterium SKYGB_i_bin93]HIK29448.1 serine/threonine protein kinase [Oscillatoriaceae cyanobacterium M7585_C2015_266]